MPALPTEPVAMPEIMGSTSSVSGPPPVTAAASSDKTTSPSASSKKKSKKKSTATSPANSNVIPFKKVPEYVQRMLHFKHDEFNDVDFAERALLCLARKISNQAPVVEEWVRSVQARDETNDCICVARPKDGRMTISKATGGNAGCKKVFPQIFVCQVFRWPNIVFHNDIKSASHCKYPGAIKPPAASTTSSNEDLNSSTEDVKDLICINPYHYEITPEATARFKRQGSKQTGSASATSPAKSPSSSSFKSPTAPPSVASAISIAGLSSTDDDSDDPESDDEILEYENDGVDYIKMWKEHQQKLQKDGGGGRQHGGFHKITEEQLLDEIKFFTLNKEKRVFEPASDELLDDLGVIEDIRSVVISGKYTEMVKLQEKPKPKKADHKLMPPPKAKVQQPSKSTQKPPGLPEDDAPVVSSVLDHVGQQQGDPGHHHKQVDEDEDDAIKDLLDDIRGSFERQFDDEFTELSAGASSSQQQNNVVAPAGALPGSVSPPPFGNIESAFSLGESADDVDVPLEEIEAAAGDLFNENGEMPCIVDTWSNAGGAGVVDNFISAGSISQEEFDNLFQDQQPGGSNSQDQSQLNPFDQSSSSMD